MPWCRGRRRAWTTTASPAAARSASVIDGLYDEFATKFVGASAVSARTDAGGHRARSALVRPPRMTAAAESAWRRSRVRPAHGGAGGASSRRPCSPTSRRDGRVPRRAVRSGRGVSRGRRDAAVALANDTSFGLARTCSRRMPSRPSASRMASGRHDLREPRARRQPRALRRCQPAAPRVNWACWPPTSSSTKSSSARADAGPSSGA